MIGKVLFAGAVLGAYVALIPTGGMLDTTRGPALQPAPTTTTSLTIPPNPTVIPPIEPPIDIPPVNGDCASGDYCHGSPYTPPPTVPFPDAPCVPVNMDANGMCSGWGVTPYPKDDPRSGVPAQDYPQPILPPPFPKPTFAHPGQMRV